MMVDVIASICMLAIATLAVRLYLVGMATAKAAHRDSALICHGGAPMRLEHTSFHDLIQFAAHLGHSPKNPVASSSEEVTVRCENKDCIATIVWWQPEYDSRLQVSESTMLLAPCPVRE